MWEANHKLVYPRVSSQGNKSRFCGGTHTLPKDTIFRSLDGTDLLVHCQSSAASHLFCASVTHGPAESPDKFESGGVRSYFLHDPRRTRFRFLKPVRLWRGGWSGCLWRGRKGSQTTELPSSRSCPASGDDVPLGQPLGVHFEG